MIKLIGQIPLEMSILAIQAYRVVISPLLPKTCRFYPSCSAYTIEALRKHGLLKGLYLGFRRIVRCNPFCEGGLDPVPAVFSFSVRNLHADLD